jgi:hypothetical protein
MNEFLDATSSTRHIRCARPIYLFAIALPLYKLCVIVVYKKLNTRRITHAHRSIIQRDSPRELAGPHHSYTCKLYVGVSRTRHHSHRRMHRKGIDNAPAIPGAGEQIMDQRLHEAIHVCCSRGRPIPEFDRQRLIGSSKSSSLVS